MLHLCLGSHLCQWHEGRQPGGQRGRPGPRRRALCKGQNVLLAPCRLCRGAREQAPWPTHCSPPLPRPLLPNTPAPGEQGPEASPRTRLPAARAAATTLLSHPPCSLRAPAAPGKGTGTGMGLLSPVPRPQVPCGGRALASSWLTAAPPHTGRAGRCTRLLPELAKQSCDRNEIACSAVTVASTTPIATSDAQHTRPSDAAPSTPAEARPAPASSARSTSHY